MYFLPNIYLFSSSIHAYYDWCNISKLECSPAEMLVCHMSFVMLTLYLVWGRDASIYKYSTFECFFPVPLSCTYISPICGMGRGGGAPVLVALWSLGHLPVVCFLWPEVAVHNEGSSSPPYTMLGTGKEHVCTVGTLWTVTYITVYTTWQTTNRVKTTSLWNNNRSSKVFSHWYRYFRLLLI